MNEKTWDFILSAILAAVILIIFAWAFREYLGLRKKKRIEKDHDISGRWVVLCKCGHPKSEHNGGSGPNSIGQYHHGECTHGSKAYPPYRFGGCNCHGFKRLILPRRYHERKA